MASKCCTLESNNNNNNNNQTIGTAINKQPSESIFRITYERVSHKEQADCMKHVISVIPNMARLELFIPSRHVGNDPYRQRVSLEYLVIIS